MPEPPHSHAQPEDGMALVAVLGFVAALSLVLIGLASASRSTLDAASRHLLRAQAQMAIESAVDYAAGTLAAARGTAPALLAEPAILDVGGFRVRISVRAERGKVDLNAADATLLATLFRAGGATHDQASALAAAVEDWRDADDLVRLNGAERRTYLQTGRSHVPANRPFRAVAEVQAVLGMTPRIFSCIGGELTVLTQAPGIEVAHADPLVLRALGIEAPAASPGPAVSPLASGQPVTPGDVYEITAELEDTTRGIRRGERVAVRLTGNPQDPYWVIGMEALFPIREGRARCEARTGNP